MKYLSLAILLAIPLAAQPAPQTSDAAPHWTDQGESDLGLAAGSEKDAAKRLDLIRKWEQQYPASPLKAQRTFMTTQTLTSLITSAFGQPEGPALDAGRKAAHQLIDGLNDYFNPSLLTVPLLSSTSAEQWSKLRTTYEMQAHALLAYSAALNKDDTTAESEYKKVLAIDPTQATTSYQLGVTIIHVIIANKSFVRFSEALWDLARSLVAPGTNPLPPDGKSAAEKALQTYYTQYHGSADGLDDLKKQAATSVFPPDGFHILSIIEIADAKAQEQKAFADAHPDLAFWEAIRTTLQTEGDAYFDSLQGVGFPPAQGDAYKGPPMFKGVVVSQPSAKEILLNVDDAQGDALLKFDDNIKGEIPAGTTLQFKGVVDAYTKAPYKLTLEVQEPKTDLTGLPNSVTFIPDTSTSKPRPATPKISTPKTAADPARKAP